MEHSNIEFVREVDSTNEYLKRMIRERPISSPYCVSASRQMSGKGQRGKTWNSDPYVNIIATFLVEDKSRLSNLATLNPVIATAVSQIVKEEGAKNVCTKWPNDIYVNDKKIAGILIEPIWSGKVVKQVVVGIGLNVNQMDFAELSATSIILETGKLQQVGDVLIKLYSKFYENIRLYHTDFLSLMNNELYKRNQVVTFDIDDRKVQYMVKQVLPNGNLEVENDGKLIELEHHRVKWIV